MSQTSQMTSSAHLELVDALPVVTSSTTSRVLVDNPAMRVVQFTFDAGEQLTEHSSPRAVACILVAGALQFTVEGTAHDMRPGDVIYLAPGAPHALMAQEASRLALVMVDMEEGDKK
ncbi:cupin domain-containing protein [Gephyromycinifex aptenodytis]|uniref:cupin domain-containing protein n=1 Tax=Gephyromycinifex aptenodytis TaxID=2716227 RepID=UPI001D009C6C|nr:cupin domain-containing protein [Gephyromycinifex aptenodytis]